MLVQNYLDLRICRHGCHYKCVFCVPHLPSVIIYGHSLYDGLEEVLIFFWISDQVRDDIVGVWYFIINDFFKSTCWCKWASSLSTCHPGFDPGSKLIWTKSIYDDRGEKITSMTTVSNIPPSNKKSHCLKTMAFLWRRR